MHRWSTLLLDHASLSEMPMLPASSVDQHFTAVAERRPTPRSLYERWEQQQWSASDIRLEADRTEWQSRIRSPVRKKIGDLIMSFLVGEYTGLDLLSPIMLSCPDEASLEFLGTQVADETRHNRLMMRLAEEVLGLSGGPRAMLTTAWNSLTPAHRGLNALETGLVGDLRTCPGDGERWVRALTLFHLITEGVLALRAQRMVVTVLRRFSVLEGTMAGFTAMLRDEARHVNFGLHSLRLAVRQGHEEAVFDVVDQALPLIIRIDIPEDSEQADPSAVKTGASILAELLLRLRQAGMSPASGERIERRGAEILREMKGVR